MFKNRLMLFFSIALILILIPAAFAHDNDIDSLGSDLNSQTLCEDIYFDSNATHDHGAGTADDPYREIRDGRILDNTVVHLKNGEYDYNQLNSHKNVSFIGQDSEKTVINGHGGILLINDYLFLSNLTICNLNILNQGNLYASNTIFANSSSGNLNSYSNSFGGAIHCVDRIHNVYLDNCTFINNHAGIGGAIYLNGGILEATGCSFIDNYAENYGGAIACDIKGSNPRITIKKSRFINDFSLNDAGGAIYVKSGIFNGEDLIFSSCNATFGGAVCLLKSYTNLSNVYAYSNIAKYDGGVIYQIYGNLALTDSELIQNSALNGGGIFCDDAVYGFLGNVSFINNSARHSAGAMYRIASDYFKTDNLTYSNNTAAQFDDFLNQSMPSLLFTADNYTLYNTLINSNTIPSSYVSYLTSVKNQLNGGNCWAFATLGALELAIANAIGEEIDLSEENMKNIAALYSRYGWQMDTNEGGYNNMGLGYLVSWLGPVLESDDSYNGVTVLSPVLESIMHVQNVRFIKRSSELDLDSIKRAIMDYGAVYSGIFALAHYDSTIGKYVQCYRGALPCDHAVVLVGWDDDFYMSGAPGKGAWIAKNSWGESWGNDGYFYVSYYDTSCPKIGDSEGAIAFILNDTIKYDKNYQYDVAKTDYLFNTTSTVWYKNIFNATENEYLAAVSTYFEKTTQWELTVIVNDDFKVKMTGNSPAGYYTLPLDEYIPLNAGDIFEVIFKISVEGDAGVPISEDVSLNNYFYTENISFISYDGRNWIDLFDLTGEYPDHVYNSQVACIKAFTILNEINTTIQVRFENRTFVAEVLNQWGYPVGYGNVTFSLAGEDYVVAVTSGIAKKEFDIKSGNLTLHFDAVGYKSSVIDLEFQNPLINTRIALNVTGQSNPINITAKIFDEDNNPVKFGNVKFIIYGMEYLADVVNGTAKLLNINVSASEFNVTAYYDGLCYYNVSNATLGVEISMINTRLSLNVTANDSNNPVNITAYVTDSHNNPVTSGSVMFLVSGQSYWIDVVDGIASVQHTFTEIGGQRIFALYSDLYKYNISYNNETIIVSKMKVNMTFNMVIDENTAVFALGIKDCARGFQILLDFKNSTQFYSSTEGSVICELNDLDKGVYNYKFRLISPLYEADDIEGQFNITHDRTQISADVLNVFYNGDFSVVLKDSSGNVLSERDVYLKIRSQTFKKRTDENGVAVFNIPVSGNDAATIYFIGDDEYVKSSITVNVNVKSTIEFLSNQYAYNSNFKATLYDNHGNVLVNAQLEAILNGVSYNLKTDSNGQVFLNIKLNPGDYPLSISNPSTGEVKIQNIKVVKRITSNNAVTMYYGAGKLYKVRVCADNGEFVKNLKVAFKINGRTYYAKTDNNGYASIKISQKPGKYTITAEYSGFKVSNKITVKSTIITKDIKVKKGKTIKFTAKLVNKNGKILKNKKITFKFKGKVYKIKTNKKGKATLKITKKYKKGKYVITSKYGKLSIKNSIRIK